VFGRELLFSVTDAAGRRSSGKGRGRGGNFEARHIAIPKLDEAIDEKPPAAELMEKTPTTSGSGPTRPR
jgi:hypothetical protein